VKFLIDRCAGKQIADWLRDHAEDLAGGAIVTVRGERIRIARRP